MAVPVPATDRQMSYLRSLVDGRGEDIHAYLIERGICRLEGFPHPVKVAERPSKVRASELIGELAPPSPNRPRYKGRGYGRRYPVTSRCTHEDYPCCGCER